MQINKTWRWFGVLVIVVLILLRVWMWVMPIVRSYFTDSYVVRSRSLNVTAAYYPLTLDGIHQVRVSQGNIVAEGYDVQLFKLYDQPPVSRKLPGGFGDLFVSDTNWQLVPALNRLEGFNTRRFVRGTTKDTIEIELPALNDGPIFTAYHGSRDSVLIVMGSGNWKRGAKAQLGYIIGWSKHD